MVFVMKSNTASYYQHNGILGNLAMASDLFVPPPGWKQVGMYTALDGITGKLLRCVTVRFRAVLYMTTLIRHFVGRMGQFHCHQHQQTSRFIAHNQLQAQQISAQCLDNPSHQSLKSLVL